MPDDLGPLPKGDRNDTLEQLSLRAFNNALPVDKFLFRDERVSDKGVDGTLEVKHGENFTNCRAQVQLKGTDANPAKAFNADGSYSKSIDSSNLNYLVNGQSPLYVIWFAKTNELRYAWARDEWKRLDAEKPDWKTDDSFTIRFSRVLTPAALDDIYRRILEEARMERRIHDALARSAPAESVVISIDPATLATTDPKVLVGYLQDGGMTLVSSGYGKQVLAWYALLNPGDAAKPRMRLVAGFAEGSLGQYHSAIGHLAAAMIGRADLSEDDRQFLEYLRGACDYHTGRISAAEYVKREGEWADRLTGVRAAEHRLEVLRQIRLPERDPDRRSALLKQMRGTVDDLLADPTAVQAQRIQARLMLLMAEGDDLNGQMIEAGGRIGIRAHAGLPVAHMANKAAEAGAAGWKDWQEKARKLHDDAADLGHPLLLADAIAARITTFASVLILKRLDSIGRGADEKPQRDIIDQLIKEAEQAIAIYKVAGSVEGEVRVKLLVADLHDVVGEPEKGKAIAEDVLPVAEAMNYGRLRAHAKEHAEGKTVFATFAAKVAQRGPMDQDIFLAQESDENVRSMAKTLLGSMMASADRIGMAEKECFVMRAIAQARVTWCRHLELISDERPLLSPATAFKEEPQRFCKCRKHGYESPNTQKDADALIFEFKNLYCSDCPDRQPLGGGA